MLFFCCPPVCYGVPYLQDPVYLKCPSPPLLLCRPCKKPLSPSCTVQMSGLEDIPVPVPLLAAALTADTRSLLLAYGSYLQPVMERLVSGAQFNWIVFSPTLKCNPSSRLLLLKVVVQVANKGLSLFIKSRLIIGEQYSWLECRLCRGSSMYRSHFDLVSLWFLRWFQQNTTFYPVRKCEYPGEKMNAKENMDVDELRPDWWTVQQTCYLC